MTLNAEVLEAAESAFAPQLSDDMKAHLHRAVERAVAVNDLVERKTLDANTLGHMVDEKLFHLEAERDEARRKTQEMIEERDHLLDELTEARLKSNEHEDKAETQGRQLAALREALIEAKDTIKAWHNMPISGNKIHPKIWDTYAKHSPEMKRINAVLTDTAAAAAQWVRVDDEHVVIEAAVLEPFIKYIKSSDGPVTQFHAHGQSETGPGISADVPDDFTLSKPSPEIHGITLGDFRALARAATPNLSSVAEGEAGEGEGK